MLMQLVTEIKKYKNVILKLFISFIVFLLFFSALTYALKISHILEPFMVMDKITLLTIHEYVPSSLVGLFKFFTVVGSPYSLIAATIILAGFLMIRKDVRASLVMLFSVGGVSVLNVVLKHIFMRTRPHLWDRTFEHGYSFPSGHSMVSIAFILALTFVLWHSKCRNWVISLGTIFMLIVGFSRLYLGVHFPTDVITGYLIAGLWTITVVYMFRFQAIDR